MVDSSMDAREWARKQLEEADPDLLRALMQTVLEDLETSRNRGMTV